MIFKTFNECINYWSKNRGGNLALVDSQSKITYRELENTIRNLQHFFLNKGIKKGDIIAISGPKNAFLVELYLSLFGIDVAVVPLPEKVSVAYMNKIVRLINPIHVISYENQFSSENEKKWFICKTNQFIKFINNESLESLRTTIELLDKNDRGVCDLNVSEEYGTYFNLTSGSTGEIKAVRVGSMEIINNALSLNKRFPMGENDCYCCLFPPEMHPHEIFSHPIITGACCLILSSSDIRNFPRYLNEVAITHIHATPYMYKKLLNIDDSKNNWKNTKYLLVGGENTTYKLRSAFFEKTSKKLTPVWGSTETTGIVLAVPDEMRLEEKEILGVSLDGYEVKIDPHNSELLIRGQPCAKGYWNSSQKSFLTKEGYYRTKDCVRIDDKGIIFYQGRMNFVIKACGRKISLNIIEHELLRLDFINEVAVIYDENEMIIYLYIDAYNQDSNDIKELKALLVNKINPIRYRILFVDSIPKLSNGKIDREFLKYNIAEGSYETYGC
ncbi:long-chain fatty acid--CoA ligase (plasmid) [Bacillus mycoides]|uniref:AMP-dependent synthetase/ligase domain-containing protein n=1 Tax=Bacillus mycoides TaxID=1405 RepID=A0ABC9QUU9_BACMY|nr:class I adenylate-forming enzyme family protein [Bacillus mycoides]EJR29912.1 hypothetical protein III_05681 [Bacillus mycoides]QWG70550.1 long-chain fatty acid--CoA ligase [Bacillus mycoides]